MDCTEFNLSDDQKCALNCALSGFDMCIFGEGGTGKSFIMQVIVEMLREQKKNVLVCAPTGIAAAEINGATIHRTFNYPSTAAINSSTNTIKTRISDELCLADVIVIDEISMVRMDFFDSMITSIREAEKPENHGRKKQIILCGDPFQLPPFVATDNEWEVLTKYYGKKIDPPWFFLGKEWPTCDFKIIELKEIFRQEDPEFKRQLGLLRRGDVSCAGYFNTNCLNTPDPAAVYLLPDNKRVKEMNRNRLNALPGETYKIPAIISDSLYQDPKSARLIEKYSEPLELKDGCRIMITANDVNSEFKSIDVLDYLTGVKPWKRRKNKYVNGSMGTVESVKVFPERHRNDSVFIRLDDDPGGLIEIYRHEYPVNRYVVRDGVLVLERIGTISVLPVVPAYAFTIHKAQGKTFKRVNVNPCCSKNGQLYVALSRAASVNGLHLLYPVRPECIKTDRQVLELMKSLPDDRPLFMPDKRGPKPKPPVREPGQPAKVQKKRGRKSSYEGQATKAVRLPADIADWITYTLNAAFPKDEDTEPDTQRYKKLMALIGRMPKPEDE